MFNTKTNFSCWPVLSAVKNIVYDSKKFGHRIGCAINKTCTSAFIASNWNWYPGWNSPVKTVFDVQNNGNIVKNTLGL